MKLRNLALKLGLVLTLSLTMAAAVAGTALADEAWTWTGPTSAVSINNPDGTRNVTVYATNAGCNIGEILGADQSCGGMYGRYDGGIKLWTSSANTNPDRYLTNLAYLWCKYNTEPASTTSTFPSEQTELSDHQYTLTVQGGTKGGQYGRTLAGSGPNTVNVTTVAEYGGIPSALYSRSDIICGSTVTNYEKYLNMMHSAEWKASEFYVEGDENYNPIFVEIATGTSEQRLNSIKDLAEAMQTVIDNSNGTIVARYGDPTTIANDLEKYVFGTEFYIKSLIDDGTLTKKSATWIASRNSADGTYNTTYYGMQICHEFFGDILDGPSTEYYADSTKDNKVYTVDELAQLDFILIGGGDSVKKQLLQDFADAGYTDIPMIMVDVNKQGFDAGWGQGGASTTWSVSYPYYWVAAYMDELAAIDSNLNPTAFYRFILERFYHINTDDSAAVTAACLANMWNLQADNDVVPNKTSYDYDAGAIERAISNGIAYATSNDLMVKGDYDKWWDPFYQVDTFADYVAQYTDNSKGCYTTQGILAAGTSVDGLYYIESGDNLSNYVFAKATGTADGTTEYYANYVTEDMFNAYKEGEADHVWQPDTTSGIGATELNYSDVNYSDWYASSVIYVSNTGLMTGYTGTTKFGPRDTMTRAMIVTVLYNAAGSPEVSGDMPFSDCNPDSWYAKPIIWAYQNGIASGYDDGTFGPNDKVTREQIAVFLYNYNNKYGTPSEGEDLTNPDANQVSSWALPAMKWAVTNGIINGYGDTGKLGPLDKASRAQNAAMLMNYFG